MNILLLNGSPAKPSHTSSTLETLKKLFEDEGHHCETIDLLTAQIPTNDPQYHKDPMQSPSEKVRNFASKIKASNIVVLGTPLYHGSFSGLLKTALDNLDDQAFYGKTILLAANASGVRGSMQAAQHLVVVPRTMRGNVYDRLIGTCDADFELSDGRYQLINEGVLDRCSQIVASLLT